MIIRESSTVHMRGGCSKGVGEREKEGGEDGVMRDWVRGGCLCDTVRKTGFLVHGFGDGDVDFFSIIKVCADFIADFPLGEFDVVFSGTFAGHQTEKPLINVNLRN